MNLCIGNSAAPGNAFQPSALVASISAPKLSDAESIRLILSAVDGGITFMDNCWDYNQGQSEIRMGEALKEGYRQKVFLMSKLDGRTKEEAATQLDESLRRLQTDHLGSRSRSANSWNCLPTQPVDIAHMLQRCGRYSK